jgi:hypothetical protein
MQKQPNQDAFIVKNSTTLNVVFAAISLVLCISFLITVTPSLYMYGFIIVATALPFVYLVKGALQNGIILKINSFGIFNGNKLLTNWQNYRLAYVTRTRQSASNLSDEYLFITEFYKAGKLYTAKLKLPQLINVNETDIIAAIKKYSTNPNQVTILDNNTPQEAHQNQPPNVPITNLLTQSKTTP